VFACAAGGVKAERECTAAGKGTPAVTAAATAAAQRDATSTNSVCTTTSASTALVPSPALPSRLQPLPEHPLSCALPLLPRSPPLLSPSRLEALPEHLWSFALTLLHRSPPLLSPLAWSPCLITPCVVAQPHSDARPALLHAGAHHLNVRPPMRPKPHLSQTAKDHKMGNGEWLGGLEIKNPQALLVANKSTPGSPRLRGKHHGTSSAGLGGLEDDGPFAVLTIRHPAGTGMAATRVVVGVQHTGVSRVRPGQGAPLWLWPRASRVPRESRCTGPTVEHHPDARVGRFPASSAISPSALIPSSRTARSALPAHGCKKKKKKKKKREGQASTDWC